MSDFDMAEVMEENWLLRGFREGGFGGDLAEGIVTF